MLLPLGEQRDPRMTVTAKILAATAAALASTATAAGAAQAPIAINVQPAVVTTNARVQVFGRIPTNRGDEDISVDSWACGGYGVWMHVATIKTTSLGAWTTTANVDTTTKFRARWRGSSSTAAVVRVRPSILLDVDRRGHLLIVVRGNAPFGHAMLQRRRGNRWVALRTIALDRGAMPESSGADLKLRLARPTTVRLVLTANQVGRCYLPSVSDPVTVR
jgi:hypothetical protein